MMPVLALFLLASCGGEKKDSNQAETVKRKVRIEAVSLHEVSQLTTFTANIEANTVNNILPAMGGRIRSISVDVGSKVAKGQTVVVMDASIFCSRKRSWQR